MKVSLACRRRSQVLELPLNQHGGGSGLTTLLVNSSPSA